MNELSVFDIIGPNMIGPSSSHTAGAVRIARVAKKLGPKEIHKVTFVLYGSFAKTYRGHGTDRALVAGILGMDQEDERIRDAFQIAKDAGLEYEFIPSDDHHYKHPNTVEIIMEDANNNRISITGSSIGGGSISIDKVNGVEVFFSGDYYTLFIVHEDVPGVMAYITKCLSEYNINIGYLRAYREHKGKLASTIMEADEPICEDVIDRITSNPSVKYAKMISL